MSDSRRLSSKAEKFGVRIFKLGASAAPFIPMMTKRRSKWFWTTERRSLPGSHRRQLGRAITDYH